MSHFCHGQLDAMSKNGDVRAIFCGHDYYNSFTVEIDGVEIINTPSIKPHILLRKINWGPRAITLHEDGTCENRVLMACELAQKDGSELISVGAFVSRRCPPDTRALKGKASFEFHIVRALLDFAFHAEYN